MRIKKEKTNISNITDISEIYEIFQEEYRNVFFTKLEDYFFIYRSLNRKEHKALLENKNFSDIEKEDIICESCLLWPEKFDFDNCEAGVPTQLAKKIIKDSFLASTDDRASVITYYRNQMFNTDYQINCIINEAFPQFDIEEIEEWDIEKTSKYLSRAEWKLQNLRGMKMNYDPYETSPLKEDKTEVVTEELTDTSQNTKKKDKLTPEKLAELQAKFPEINWAEDSILKEGISAMKGSVDTKAVALRTGI